MPFDLVYVAEVEKNPNFSPGKNSYHGYKISLKVINGGHHIKTSEILYKKNLMNKI